MLQRNSDVDCPGSVSIDAMEYHSSKDVTARMRRYWMVDFMPFKIGIYQVGLKLKNSLLSGLKYLKMRFKQALYLPENKGYMMFYSYFCALFSETKN